MKNLPSDYLEQGWCQNAAARDADGYGVPSISNEAVAWCLMGSAKASFKVPGENREIIEYMADLRDVLFERYGYGFTVAEVNDEIYDPETGQAQAVADAREAERRAGLR